MPLSACVGVCVRACVLACVCACMHACARACVCMCVTLTKIIALCDKRVFLESDVHIVPLPH